MKTIDSPGIYDISAEDYHADPCPAPSLSSSIAKLLDTRTPLHAWHGHPRLNPVYEPEESTAFDLGKAAHSLILHDPTIFDVIDAPDYRTKDAQRRRDEARADGRIPLLREQYVRVCEMVGAAGVQLEQHAEASRAFTDGKPEQTLIWREGDVWCRARLDWLPNSGDTFYDYKSAWCADPDAFSRIAPDIGHDIQAAFYTRGIRALGICDRPKFRFIVQEKDKPFALSVCALSPSALDLAERKVERAIRQWAECLQTDRWPGYPLQTCFVDSPAWAEARQMEREERQHDARSLERAAAAQAPL